MNILGLDTATESCSAALCVDGDILSAYHETKCRGQSEILFSMLEKIFNEASFKPIDLDLISTTVGPGSFTGLRIGISAARGLGLATKTQCHGVTTTEAIIESLPKDMFERVPVLVILDSKRDDWFVQAFGIDRVPICEIRAIHPNEINAWLSLNISGQEVSIVGNAVDLAVSFLKKGSWKINMIEHSGVPDAQTVATFSFARWKLGVPLREPIPIYIRPPDAKMPKSEGRLRP